MYIYYLLRQWFDVMRGVDDKFNVNVRYKTETGESNVCKYSSSDELYKHSGQDIGYGQSRRKQTS